MFPSIRLIGRHWAAARPGIDPRRVARRCCAVLSLLLGAGLLADDAPAAVLTLCNIAGAGFSGGGGGSGIATCDAAAVADGGTGGGTASAEAAIGVLNASASVFQTLQHRGEATAIATWFDTITISAPGLDASDGGTLTFGYYLLGSLDATGRGTASAGLAVGTCQLALCSAGNTIESFSVEGDGGGLAVGLVDDHFINFRFGETFGIAMTLGAGGLKPSVDEPPFAGSAEALFTGTAYWGGILDIRHNGVSVPYTITTGSGIDLRQSFIPGTQVPEPATTWLLAAGLAALWLRPRRRPCG